MSNELLLAREGFAAWQRGDFAAVEELLDPSAEWRWFEPGEWDCRNRDDVMRTLRERHAQGFAQADLELVDPGRERVIVVSHPSRIGGDDWPDETATVLSFRAGKVVDMQDYRTRDEAVAATTASRKAAPHPFGIGALVRRRSESPSPQSRPRR